MLLLKMYGHFRRQDPAAMAERMIFRVRMQGPDLEQAMALRMTDIKQLNKMVGKL